MFSRSVLALTLAAVVLAEQTRHTVELIQRTAPEATLRRRQVLASRAADIPLADYYLGTDLQ